MKSPKTPASPDYASLAQQQSQLEQSAADRATQANRYNQQNPYGSMTWDKQAITNPDGTSGGYNWTSKVNLSPEQQYLFDKTGAAQREIAAGTPEYAQRVSQYLSGPMETGEGVRSRVESELLGKLNTQSDRDLESTRARLLNQGVTENSEAWRRAMVDFDLNRQQARSTAILNAGGEASRQVDLSNTLRNQYLNELGAMLSGSQATIPNYQYGQAVNSGAPNIYGAAQDQYASALQNYNAKVAQQAQLYNTAGQLGAASLFAASDISLKSNLVRVGDDPRGFAIYEYDIQDRRERGVLAQEIEGVYPEAVVKINGKKHVNYGYIGITREVLNG